MISGHEVSFVAGVSFDDPQTPLASTRTRRAIILNALLFTFGFTMDRGRRLRILPALRQGMDQMDVMV